MTEIPPPVPKPANHLMTVLIFLAPFVAFVLLIMLWPKTEDWAPLNPAVFEWLSFEVRLMLIILVSGAVGASVGMARAYAYFKGMGRYDEKWKTWYLLHIPVGMGLALIFYFVVRGGLFTTSFSDPAAARESINPFGFAAFSALTGMFARQASQKLEEIFENLFSVADTEGSTATASRPVVTTVSGPIKVGASSAELDITITGTGFNDSSTAQVEGKDRPIKDRTPTVLVVTLDPTDVAIPGTLKLVVKNGRDASLPVEVEVTA